MLSSILRFALPLVIALGVAGSASHARAVTVGQDDTFQDGTTDNWATGQTQPVNISTGGPAGAGDRFLQLTSDGSGSNGRLTGFNRSQWIGNYVAAGVTAIDMDLNNFSSVTLSIRLAFKSSTFNGASGYESSSAFSLAANSGWQHVVFLITPATMTAVGGPAAFSSFFANPAEMRIINASSPGDLNGSAVIGQLGIDNIIAVPEPRSLGLLLAGAIWLGIGLCRRRR